MTAPLTARLHLVAARIFLPEFSGEVGAERAVSGG
jgi:hypothetical protein